MGPPRRKEAKTSNVKPGRMRAGLKSESHTHKEAADVFVDEPFGGSVMYRFIRRERAADTQWKNINEGNASSENKSSSETEQELVEEGS